MSPHPLPEQPALLRIHEVAQMLGISRSTTYELMAQGRLESVQIGRSRRVPREAVDVFVAQLRSGEVA